MLAARRLLALLLFAQAQGMLVVRQTLLRAATPRRRTISSCMSADDEAAFRDWMQSAAPPGASVTNRCEIVTSGAETVQGALRDVWLAINAAAQPGAPPVSVLLLPGKRLQKWENFSGLHKHLLSCRDCCDVFGKQIRLTPLHPLTEAEATEVGQEKLSEYEVELRRSPMAAFSITSRVGPTALKPELEEADRSAGGAGGTVEVLGSLVEADDETPSLDEEALRKAKAAMERQFQAVDSSAVDVDPPKRAAVSAATVGVAAASDSSEVLAETMRWYVTIITRVLLAAAAAASCCRCCLQLSLLQTLPIAAPPS